MRFCQLRFVRFILPNESCERSLLFDQFLNPPGVVDDSLDLAPMPDDTVVFKQTFHITLGELRDPVEIKIMEC